MRNEVAKIIPPAPRALVLGANGFIGSNLVDRLLREGWRVRAFDRSPSKFRPDLPAVEYVYGEFGNVGLIRDALAGMEVVFHLVSTTLPKTSNDDPVYDVRSNLVDTVQMLEEAARVGIRKIVFASSGGTIYGLPQADPISEDHPTEPICSYGITKLACEKYLELFRHLYDLDYTILRISNPYGAYQAVKAIQGAVAVFLGKALLGEPIQIWGDGSVVRDYLFAEDLAEAMIAAAAPLEGPRLYNIGSGKGVSLRELVQEITSVLGHELHVEYLPGRPFDVPRSVLQVRRAWRHLGWEARTPLREGLRRTTEWMTEHLPELSRRDGTVRSAP